MAATTGCANGLCENAATKRIGYKNISGAKRSALPACRISTISSEQCLLTELDPSELDPSWNYYTQIELRRHYPSQRRITNPPVNITLSIDHCARPPKPQVFAYCILRACLGHASSTANFRRHLPSRAPSYFPFENEPFHAIPHSCIHIPNILLIP